MPLEKCKSCPFPKDSKEIQHNVWKEEESKYKWNKPGNYKDSSWTCKVCGHSNHFVNV